MKKEIKTKKISSIMTIDIGTSSIRVSLFDLEGNMLDRQSENVYAPSQFDVTDRMEIMYSLMRTVASNSPNSEIIRICTSTLISWIFAKKDGTAVTPVYTFADYHENEMQEYIRRMDKADFYQRTGRAVSAELPLFKMMWLKNTAPQQYDQSDWLLSYHGYINMCLTGNAYIDYTFAAFTGMSNIQDAVWDKTIIKTARVDKNKLPPLCDAEFVVGTLLPEMQNYLGIGPAQVVCGTSDGSAGVLGSGELTVGNGIDVMGSTDVFYVLSDKTIFEKEARLSVHPHPIKGYWLVGGATGLTGGAYDWMVKKLGNNMYTFDEINLQIDKLPPGSEGVKAVCAFTGERAPRWIPGIKGGIVNLGLEHTLAHCCRAMAEASAYLTKEICQLLDEEELPIGSITAIGGGAKASAILKLRSNVLNCLIKVPEYVDATTRGCFALAMLSLGRSIKDFQLNQVACEYQPQHEYAKQYEQLFRDYIAFYEQYKKIYIM